MFGQDRLEVWDIPLKALGNSDCGLNVTMTVLIFLGQICQPFATNCLK